MTDFIKKRTALSSNNPQAALQASSPLKGGTGRI